MIKTGGEIKNTHFKKDLTEYRDLYFEFHPRLVLFANKFTGDMDAAKDIVQDAFVNLWEKADHLDIQGPVGVYLFQVVKNRCLNYSRHLTIKRSVCNEIADMLRKAELSVYNDFNDPFHSLLEVELENHISGLVEKLPDNCRRVYKLSRIEQLKNKEIALKLNISVKMVEKHISKALRVLRVELADYCNVLLFGLGSFASFFSMAWVG